MCLHASTFPAAGVYHGHHVGHYHSCMRHDGMSYPHFARGNDSRACGGFVSFDEGAYESNNNFVVQNKLADLHNRRNNASDKPSNTDNKDSAPADPDNASHPTGDPQDAGNEGTRFQRGNAVRDRSASPHCVGGHERGGTEERRGEPVGQKDRKGEAESRYGRMYPDGCRCRHRHPIHPFPPVPLMPPGMHMPQMPTPPMPPILPMPPMFPMPFLPFMPPMVPMPPPPPMLPMPPFPPPMPPCEHGGAPPLSGELGAMYDITNWPYVQHRAQFGEEGDTRGGMFEWDAHLGRVCEGYQGKCCRRGRRMCMRGQNASADWMFDVATIFNTDREEVCAGQGDDIESNSSTSSSTRSSGREEDKVVE